MHMIRAALAAAVFLFYSALAGDCSAYPRQNDYRVTVTQRAAAPLGAALISFANGSSAFNFSFTTAWFPAGADGAADGLIVRNVECNPNHHSCAGVAHPEWSNAGALAVVRATLGASGPLSAERVTLANVTWMGAAAPPPRANASRWGFADPRAAFRAADGLVYVTFDNCTQNCYPTRTTLLATSRDPMDASAWTLRGPLLGADAPYTGGAALLFRDGEPGAPPHLAFVGDSDTANAIWLAQSADGLAWAVANKTWMLSRPDCWDHYGVAPAGQPARLSNGDYLFIYNIDTGFPYHPNPLGRCAVGWVVLDGADPSRIVARADEPLLVPVLPYETCANAPCQQPHVVFSTGLKPLGGDEFLVLYGGGDTVVGVSRIFVNVSAAGTAKIPR
jgi:predicted GH43/DUF377 family glycosyl hydrolase